MKPETMFANNESMFANILFIFSHKKKEGRIGVNDKFVGKIVALRKIYVILQK